MKDIVNPRLPGRTGQASSATTRKLQPPRHDPEGADLAAIIAGIRVKSECSHAETKSARRVYPTGEGVPGDSTIQIPRHREGASPGCASGHRHPTKRIRHGVIRPGRDGERRWRKAPIFLGQYTIPAPPNPAASTATARSWGAAIRSDRWLVSPQTIIGAGTNIPKPAFGPYAGLAARRAKSPV